jgi:acid phosphatase (class A)
MKQKRLLVSLSALLLSPGLFGQMPPQSSAGAKTPDKPPVARKPYYIDAHSLRLDLILAPPPAGDSPTTATELKELHRIEATRTPTQVSLAEADDSEEDIFLFKRVLGPAFNAEALPLTAALSARIRKDESSASTPLKNTYRRPRPYQIDSSLHPVCPLSPEPTSYPSGHSLSGYLLAFTLVQLIPEKRQQIFDRADEYAHNRLICGVHYASDIVASREAAYAIFGSMTASSTFQRDLEAARDETRSKLGLSLAAHLE